MFIETCWKAKHWGFLAIEGYLKKEKEDHEAFPFFSISIKSIARRLLPSRACVLFLFTRTKIMHTK
jgi:hypothetical protein